MTSFLGAYVFDEPGGKQIDYGVSQADKPVKVANNDTDAAIHFVFTINNFLYLFKNLDYASPNLKLYTSDFALYWFDYLTAYDVVFGEFVGNQSQQLAIAMTRGAAETLGKQWGTMITWKYQQPPYLEDADQLYSDMVLAYENKANYIVVFNSPDRNPPITELGILTPDHIDAIKKFWDYAKTHPQPKTSPATTAYVLPADYGYAFRGPTDTIWGLWPSDGLSAKMWNDANATLTTYGMKLDIVYENRTDDIPINLPYDKLIFWNGTTITR